MFSSMQKSDAKEHSQTKGEIQWRVDFGAGSAVYLGVLRKC
jgi:hypothetical protein